MKICLCGHRDARHEELSARGWSGRGACLACDCGGFEVPPDLPVPVAVAPEPCCVGEPCFGDPQGMHSEGCPVGDGNASAMQDLAHPPETAPVVEQPQLTEEVHDGRLIEEVVSDGERLLSDVPERVEGPAPAAGGVVEHVDPTDEGCSLVVPMKGISNERVRALFAGPLAFKRKRFLGAYDSWLCEPCGSRAFEQYECCGSPMRPVRVEIHAREVP